MKYTVGAAHWRIPSEVRAFEGWLEGSPTQEQKTARLAEVARQRENWVPNNEAWGSLQDLECFIGQRVRVQFWDPIMFLLDDEGPYPVHADCLGIVLLRQESFLQAYLILDRIEEYPTERGSSPKKFLKLESELNVTLASVGELLELETID